VGRTSVLTPWGGEFGEYQALGGMRLPTRAKVYWELDEGRFVYAIGDRRGGSVAPTGARHG
jgi:hypothetical protein